MRFNNIGVLAVVVALGLAPIASAQQVYMTVKTQKGALKGSGQGGRIPVVGYSYEADFRNAGTGMGMNQSAHKPVTITKEWDAASSQLLDAASSNEVLPSVEIEFFRNGTQGGKMGFSGAPFETITLTRASISSIKQYSTMLSNGTVRWLEDVTFTFQKIDFTNNQAHATGQDAWTQ